MRICQIECDIIMEAALVVLPGGSRREFAGENAAGNCGEVDLTRAARLETAARLASRKGGLWSCGNVDQMNCVGGIVNYGKRKILRSPKVFAFLLTFCGNVIYTTKRGISDDSIS